MTKQVNLICGGYPVQTLNDLQQHFCVEDILKYYHNGLLQKWLSDGGYETELIKVNNMNRTGTYKDVLKLSEIFNVEIDEKYNTACIFDDYYNSFLALVKTIISNNKNISIIKSSVKVLNEQYLSLFKLTYRALFYLFYNKAPLAIYVMLTYDNMREKYIYDEKDNAKEVSCSEKKALKIIETPALDKLLDINRTSSESNVCLDESNNNDLFYEFINNDRRKMYTDLCDIVTPINLHRHLGDNLKIFQGETDSYWKDIEQKGKKYMIFSIEPGMNIRSAGNYEQNYSSEDVNNRFLILDGIDYRSDDQSNQVYYMEV